MTLECTPTQNPSVEPICKFNLMATDIRNGGILNVETEGFASVPGQSYGVKKAFGAQRHKKMKEPACIDPLARGKILPGFLAI